MEPSAIQTGTVIDRYTVESTVGEGGMAVVFRVRHNTLGTVHALKVLTFSSRQIRERLKQEGQAQAKLQHPNVVSVTDVIDLGGTDALIMEFVDGPSLDALMRQQRLTIPQVDELANGIFAGVAEAHRLGYVHRDLKPGNVLLKVTPRGYLPKVADFGLAKSLGGGSDPGRAHTRTGSTMGTPHYMSPEQVRDSKNVGPRSDIFSLGAVLYEMVAGRRAFDGLDLLDIFNAVASGSCPPIRSLVPEIPPRMEAAIQAAMQVDPQQRPESVEALAAIWRGTNGITLAPGSAFDLPVVPASQPPPRGTETWAAAETLPDSQAPPTNSTLGPKSVPARVAVVVGVGGGAAALLAVVLLAIGGVGGIWWLTRPAEVAEAPALQLPAAPKAQAPAPVAVEAGPAPAKPRKAPAPPVVVEDPPPAEVPAEVPVVEEVPAEPEPPQAVVIPAPAEDPTPELIGMQASDDWEERLVAVNNLSKRADDEAVRILDHFVRADPDSRVRHEAWTVVADRYNARFGDVGILEETVVWQMEHGPMNDAVVAVEIFARYGTQPGLLAGPIRHASADVRATVAAVVTKVAGRANGPYDYDALLAPLLNDVDDGVRRKATAALAELP